RRIEQAAALGAGAPPRYEQAGDYALGRIRVSQRAPDRARDVRRPLLAEDPSQLDQGAPVVGISKSPDRGIGRKLGELVGALRLERLQFEPAELARPVADRPRGAGPIDEQPQR